MYWSNFIVFLNMSSGTPRSMRQRHSWGYASSGDDLEDDACSRPQTPIPSISGAKTWIEVLENALWIASAIFIVYFGDWQHNFIYLLWHDERIRRIPLYFGLSSVVLNICYFFYTSISTWAVKKYSEKWEMIGDSALPFVSLGLISFCLLTFALWPIFSFLTLPLVFTLFMAGMVVSPYMIIGTVKSQSSVLRAD